MNLDRCPSTLAVNHSTYSAAALRKVFFGKRVNHILPFLPSEKDEKVNEAFMENRKRLSISGVQKKLSLELNKNKLLLTRENDRGQYILKPIPDDVKRPDQVPANEHVTMQIAEQVFNIQTAANGMIFFQDGQPAYITRRFDYRSEPSGNVTKYGVEDFASLAQRTKATHGADFKYEGSCEDLFRLLKEYVGPYLIEAEKLFRLVVFNYLFSNGDAHLKNYSLIETNSGDYILTPAYDLMNTRIHVNDSDVAMRNGLFEEYETESFKANGYYAYDDFIALGKRAELPESVVRKEIKSLLASRPAVVSLVGRSFLEEKIKSLYIELFDEKMKRLLYSYTKIL